MSRIVVFYCTINVQYVTYTVYLNFEVKPLVLIIVLMFLITEYVK